MSIKLHRLTRSAVLAAMDEFVRLGRAAFLAKYGFGRARDYFVRHPTAGVDCDSKAIAGASYGYQWPAEGPLSAKDFSGGDATVARTLTGLGFEMVGAGGEWSELEVELIVADYLNRLTLELTGQSDSQSARLRSLKQRLPGKSGNAIAYEQARISAVLSDLGFPYLRSVEPVLHFQRDVLTGVVTSMITRFPLLDEAALSAVERPALMPEPIDFSLIKGEVPVRQHRIEEAAPAFLARSPIRRDYLEREARNRSLGAAGEKFVVAYERWRLDRQGLGQLATQVEHVSTTRGDGLGYDVLSFERDGRERFIEVKTTTFGETTPFFVSVNEARFARQETERFRLYRLFNFRLDPRFFELPGALEQHCHLDPSTYRASMR